MSRKIENDIFNAINNDKEFSGGNTNIINGSMILHGYHIAKVKEGGFAVITNCGYQTNVTKSRLNCIKGVSIYQKNFKWFLNDKEWDGTHALLNQHTGEWTYTSPLAMKN